jgi:hypothetical protein
MRNLLATSLVATALAVSPVIAFAANPSSTGGPAQMQMNTTTKSGPVTSKAQAKMLLQSKGYTDITGLKKSGNNFVASSAKKNGVTMHSVEVNAETGAVMSGG